MTDDNRYTRRAALQRAALGAGTLAAATYTPRAWAGASAPAGTIDAFQGTLLSKSSDSLVVERYGRPVTVAVGVATDLWKGGPTSLAGLIEGDDVLVRTVGAQTTNVWSNLAMVRGVVTGTTASGYEVQDDHAATSYEVVITSATKSEDAFGRMSVLPAKLPVGTWIHSVGLGMNGTILGAVARIGLPDTKPLPLRIDPPTVVYDAAGALVSFEYRQFASVFSCPTGAGRCATCNTSNSSQLAWPALDTCGCCTSTCCDCAKNCLAQAYLSCGSAVIVTDPCTLISDSCNVVTCGPCNNQSCQTCSPITCGHVCSECGGTISVPVVDLTMPTFAVFANITQRMCIRATVKNGV